jgi:hypothetical protein
VGGILVPTNSGPDGEKPARMVFFIGFTADGPLCWTGEATLGRMNEGRAGMTERGRYIPRDQS